MKVALPPVPQLTDEYLVLRPLLEGDAEAVFHACHDDPDILRWAMRPVPFTREAATEWIRKRHERHEQGLQLTFAIAQSDSDPPLGSIWLGRFDWEARRAEFGYWVAATGRGKGTATRAVALVSDWAFKEMSLLRVQILAPVENLSSQRVAEKAGFTNEGVLRSYRNIAGRPEDLVMYSLLSSDTS